MKIGVAQIKPVNGDIQRNVIAHQRLIDLSVSNGAEMVIFPELSITGYDRALASDIATDRNDHRFDIFQTISDTKNITIGIGAPTRNQGGVCISLILFQPWQARQSYSKMHLHSSEELFFIPGQSVTGLVGENLKAALAICYELSVPEHAANAFKNGANTYIASVADPVDGIEKVLARLSDIARKYSMTVVMSNCIGRSSDFEWGGMTSVWNNQGLLLNQLNETNEGVIVIDTETQEVQSVQL